MASGFLIYGATGFVGAAIARAAVQAGLRPLLGARNAARLQPLAAELGAHARVFGLDDAASVDRGLADMSVVLNCAGPFMHTAKAMVGGCLRNGVHYLDITGEIPVYDGLAGLDARAKSRNIMLLPGAGFDVTPTDCLALHLKNRLPTANRLTLAFQSVGPSGLPPGTQRTAIEMLPYGDRVRRDGVLARPENDAKTRMIDFGQGPVQAHLLPWGDVFTAYVSTGIPNIADYFVPPPGAARLLAIARVLRPLFRIAAVRALMQRGIKPGPTATAQARTTVHVWGEVTDPQQRTAVARLRGPEAGVIWTTRAALAAARHALAGDAPPGYQTPAKAYGADFVLECEGVTREDVA